MSLIDDLAQSELLSDLTISVLSANTPAVHNFNSNQHSALPYDIIQHILFIGLNSLSPVVITTDDTTTQRLTHRPQSNYAFLAKCALVCHEFRVAAATLLYRVVAVSPKMTIQLNLREGLTVQASSSLVSAMLPHNAGYVRSLEISRARGLSVLHCARHLKLAVIGYISPRPGPRNPLPGLIPLALKAFTGLKRVIFVPRTYHDQLFDEALPILKTIPTLEILEVNSACFGKEILGGHGADEVVKVGLRGEACNDVTNPTESSGPGGIEATNDSRVSQKPVLKSIGLVSPGRSILDKFPGWLEELKRQGGTLEALYLKEDCGSITPGVLRSFLPHIKDTLAYLTLGISYSLTDDDVFSFVDQLKCLESLKLRYYWQLRSPKHIPRLAKLRTFTVSYPGVVCKAEVVEFCKWVRRVIKGSPGLEALVLRTDDDDANWDHNRYYRDSWDADSYRPPAGSYDPLISHLSDKHGEGLKVLDLGTGFLSVKGWKMLCRGCRNLEVLRARVCRGFLKSFNEHSHKLTKLRTLDIILVHVPTDATRFGRYARNVAWVEQAFQKGGGLLCRIRIQGIQYQVRWAIDDDGNTRMQVDEMDREVIKPPWRRW